jgi:hypothetical protein
MWRLTVRRTDGPADVLCAEAAPPTPRHTRIVAAFIESKAVEAYFDIDEGTDALAIGALAGRLGFDYEVTEVEPVLARVGGPEPTAELDPPPRRSHSATITQVLMEPDGRTVCVQARHRRHEAVHAVDVSEDDHNVRIGVLVGVPEDDPFAGCASLALGFSWIRTRLDRPLGERRIVHAGSSPGRDAPKNDVATASAEDVLARLERYAARVRASSSKFHDLAPAPDSSPPAPTNERRRKVWVSRRPLPAS